MTTISFDKVKYRKLKREYEQAVKEGKEIFLFEGHEVLVAYAKYMLEYLATIFEGR